MSFRKQVGRGTGMSVGGRRGRPQVSSGQAEFLAARWGEGTQGEREWPRHIGVGLFEGTWTVRTGAQESDTDKYGMTNTGCVRGHLRWGGDKGWDEHGHGR